MKTYKVEIDNKGTIRYYKRWRWMDIVHRKDGPAIEYADGTKFWYLNGRLHREDGPAIEYSTGGKRWFLNNIKLSEEEFNTRMNKNSCAGKVITIEGKQYTLTEI